MTGAIDFFLLLRHTTVHTRLRQYRTALGILSSMMYGKRNTFGPTVYFLLTLFPMKQQHLSFYICTTYFTAWHRWTYACFQIMSSAARLATFLPTASRLLKLSHAGDSELTAAAASTQIGGHPRGSLFRKVKFFHSPLFAQIQRARASPSCYGVALDAALIQVRNCRSAMVDFYDPCRFTF